MPRQLIPPLVSGENFCLARKGADFVAAGPNWQIEPISCDMRIQSYAKSSRLDRKIDTTVRFAPV